MLEFTDAWMGTQERVEGFVLLEKTREKRFKKKKRTDLKYNDTQELFGRTILIVALSFFIL